MPTHNTKSKESYSEPLKPKCHEQERIALRHTNRLATTNHLSSYTVTVVLCGHIVALNTRELLCLRLPRPGWRPLAVPFLQLGSAGPVAPRSRLHEIQESKSPECSVLAPSSDALCS